MTPEDWEYETRRIGVWWAVGLRPWSKPELFLEYRKVPKEVFAEAVDAFIAEGTNAAPSPAALWKKVRELTPPELVGPSGDCYHDRRLYPFAFETPKLGQPLVVVECLDCGAEMRKATSNIRTPGMDAVARVVSTEVDYG
jgi:hypothetical protein